MRRISDGHHQLTVKDVTGGDGILQPPLHDKRPDPSGSGRRLCLVMT
jgi:hypothetical protein